MPDLRTLLAILLVFAFAYGGLGRDLPFDLSAPVPLVSGLLLFTGYFYLMRSFVRLPFALVITIRRTRYARSQYGLNGRESLRDGFVRGFLDTRRWTVAPLATIDRLAVVGFTLLATTPYLGLFLVRFGGLLGIMFMLVLYLFRGTFGFLVEDSLQTASPRMTPFPFLKIRDD